MIGTVHELCRGFAYLYCLWQPAWLNSVLEMRHTHDIGLIHPANTPVRQIQLSELFLAQDEVVVGALMVRGQWIPHDTVDEGTVHKLPWPVLRLHTRPLL